MTAAPGPDDRAPLDPSRRTSLAAERTWLAWWRTGLGASAVALAVGRILPGLTAGSHRRVSPATEVVGYRLRGPRGRCPRVGAVRQNRVAGALRRGEYDEISPSLVVLLTIVAVALALATVVVVAL
ncbi:MAG: DUF202 domain-containing protein [Solirubrobacteraceae bacterium]